MASNETIEQEKAAPTVLPTDFELLIVNMDKVLFEGKAKTLIAPGPYGDFAILPGHGPLYTTLKAGKIMIDSDKGKEEFEIENGVAKINQFKATLLVGFIENTPKK